MSLFNWTSQSKEPILNKTIGSAVKSKKKMNKTRKKMACSPLVEGKTVSQETCYTSDALIKIKKAFNKNNPDKAISSNDPQIVFQELQTKLAKCKKEDCWLKQLPKTEQTYLDEYIFAPDQPDDWKKTSRKKINKWVSNFDIDKVLKQYEKKYPNFKQFGPTPIDFDTKLPEEGNSCVWNDICNFSLEKLIKQKINKMGFVFNLDEHDEDGSHWTSMFIDMDEHVIFYFDSAASGVPSEVKKLIKRIREQGKKLNIKFRYYDNMKRNHQDSDTECGMFALFFIVTMLTNKTELETDLTMQQKLKMFRNKKIPDTYVKKYREIYFNN